MMWIAIVLNILLMGIILFYSLRNFKILPTWLCIITKYLVQTFTTWYLIPLTVNYASFIVCDATNTNMFWYPAKCWSSYHILYFIFSLFGLFSLVVMIYYSGTFLFPDLPDSIALTARPSGDLPLITALSNFLLAVLVHLLLSQNLPQVYAAILCAVCFIQGILYAVFLPYYNLRMNQFRVGQMFLVA